MDGAVVAGIGLSGGKGEPDIACGPALRALLAPAGHQVVFEADIEH